MPARTPGGGTSGDSMRLAATAVLAVAAIFTAVIAGRQLAAMVNPTDPQVELDEIGVGSTDSLRLTEPTTDQATPEVASASVDPDLPKRLLASDYSAVGRWLAANRSSARAPAIQSEIGAYSSALWFGDWQSDNQKQAATAAREAKRENAALVVAIYQKLLHQCEPTLRRKPANQRSVIELSQSVARGLGDAPAVVIWEPISLSFLACVEQKGERRTRLEVMSTAVGRFSKTAPNALIYLNADMGTSVTAEQMAGYLHRAGLRKVRGFALNVPRAALSNRELDDMAKSINQKLRAEYGYSKPYVVDTSRNGVPGADPCGSNARVGSRPAVLGGPQGPEMRLWLKAPGEWDEECSPKQAFVAYEPRRAMSLLGRA
ncbi:MAG: glycoside hydrolase family 6 protein [Nocardioides sp.]